MTRLNNTAEGGTNGGAATTLGTGGASGDAFDEVISSTITFTSTSPLAGSLSYLFSATATQILGWDGTESATCTGRFYFSLPSLPTGDHQLVSIRTTAGQIGTDIAITSTGQIRSTCGSSAGTASVPTMSATTRYRCEFQCSGLGTASSSLATQIYVGDNTGSPFASSTKSGATTASGTSRVRFGRPNNETTLASGLKMDNFTLEFGSNTPLGPAVMVTAGVATVTVSLPFDPLGGSTSIQESTSVVAVTVTANDAKIQIKPNAGVASVTGAANSISNFTTSLPDAGVASVGVGAFNATIVVSPGVFPQTIGISVAALNATIATSVAITNALAQTAYVVVEAPQVGLLNDSHVPWFFITPIVRERWGLRRGLWSRMHTDRGVSILRFGGSFQQIEMPSDEQMTTADAVYIGGRIYAISRIEAELLQQAGYSQYVTTDPTIPIDDIDFSQYGAGSYGSGPYGA